MQRTECLGSHPIYTVKSFEEGRVLHQGRKHASPKFGVGDRNSSPDVSSSRA